MLCVPNIVEHDTEKMRNYLASWSQAKVSPFWFQRPCNDVLSYSNESADAAILPVKVEYTNSPPYFRTTRPGNFTWIDDMDEANGVGHLEVGGCTPSPASSACVQRAACAMRPLPCLQCLLVAARFRSSKWDSIHSEWRK